MRYVLVFLLIAGCANPQPVADSWKGKQLDQLISAWGNPDRMTRLSNGNHVAAWETDFAAMGYSYHCKTWFTADPQGVLLEMKQEGDDAACYKFLSSKG